jgi:hypothetical protein
MAMPEQAVTLTPDQVVALNDKLSHLRHDINNHLAMITAAAELLRFKPEMRERLTITLSEQPQKIITELAKFSEEFEQTLGIGRG